MKNVNITGISSLIDDLREVYNEVRNGRIRVQDSRKITDVANTLIRAAAQKQAYNEYLDKKDKIPFLND